MTDKVRFVGDPVAFVVAETLAQASDAAEAVELDIDPLPAVTGAAEAAKPGAPQLYEHVPNNVVLDYHYGDAAKIDAAFAAAAHVTKLDIDNTRVAVVAMEPRVGARRLRQGERSLHAACADPGRGRQPRDAGEAPERAGRQDPHPHRQCRRLVRHEVRQLSRIYLHPARGEAARPAGEMDRRALGQLPLRQPRPRQRCTPNSRSTSDGNFLAVRLNGFGNVGAYIAGVMPSPLSLNTGKNLASVYSTPLIEVNIKSVLTNTTLMGAYRGAGRPEANYFMERLIDRAADEMGIDRVTLRKRNLIKPAQMPFAAASGITYDSGDFQGVLAKALEVSDYAGFAKRKKESRKHGKLRGIAVGSYLEVTAPPSGELGKITFDQDGGVTLTTGTLDYGQGHASPFAQVLSAQLGVPFDNIRSSRTTATSSASATAPAARARSPPAARRSSRPRRWSSRRARRPRRMCWKPPKPTSNSPAAASPSPAPTAASTSWIWRSGCGRARADGVPVLARRRPRHRGGAVDLPERLPRRRGRGRSRHRRDAIVNYTGVNDFGTVVNPLMVAGQVHGGVAQGIGQALME